ncbi:MAG: TauD/TfdA dioxygenase family protein [Gammaproteobacteria bacterium]
MPLQTRRLEPFGYEITGLDLDKPIEDVDRERILALWIEDGLLVFPAAGTSAEGQMRLSRCFGELKPAATDELNVPGNPYLMALAYNPERARKSKYFTLLEIGGKVRAGWLGWHWDQTFTPEIVRGAVLRMLEPACEMGETGFIDAIGAYDRLPPALRARVDGLEIVYQYTPQQDANRFGFPKDMKLVFRDERATPELEKRIADFPPTVHPLVITQPETGRKALKLSPMHCKYVLGLPQAESDALLEELAAHLVDERHAYFHRWGRNDLVAWDNWRILHCANGTPPDVSRLAQRTTILGDYKVGRYLDPTLERGRYTARIDD